MKRKGNYPDHFLPMNCFLRRKLLLFHSRSHFLQIPLPRPLSSSTSSASELPLQIPPLTTPHLPPPPPPAADSAAAFQRSLSKPAVVLSLFESYGFGDAHITKLVQKHPECGSFNLEILKAKLQFFRGAGFSGCDTGKLFSSDGQFFRTSLPNRISPNFDRLRELFGGQDGAVKAALQIPRLLLLDLKQRFLPNIEALRRKGVPEAKIKRAMRLKPRAMFLKPEKFEESIRQLEEMGYDFSTGKPIRAFLVLATLSNYSERKFSLFKSLGWSEEQILAAFKKKPDFIEVPEEKIRQRVDFFVNKLNWSPADIAARPTVLMLSLEKRIIPRCSVFNLLASKGFIKKRIPEVLLITMAEKKFFDLYVKKYQDKMPEIIDAYRGKLEFVGFASEFNKKPNMKALQRHGVSRLNIKRLAKEHPRALLVNTSHFEDVLQGLKQMGYDFSSAAFVDALFVLATMLSLTSQRKFALYRGLGWSDDEIVTAFKKEPKFVLVSDDKIIKIAQFLNMELNWGSVEITASPSLFLLSLEKSIIPRYSVFKILVSKRALRKKRPEVSYFLMNEDRYLRNYIKKYGDKFPEVLDAYKDCMESVASEM